MKLAEEAQAHVNAKKKQFRHGIRDYASNMEQFMLDNLYATHELDNARRNLQAAILWAEESAEVHGIK